MTFPLSFRKSFWRAASGIFAAALLLGPRAHALAVEKYDPAVNDRFASGYPNAPVPNSSPRFIGKGLDWSGVGWLASDPKRSVTLISPRHFIYPLHWAPNVGEKITFLNRDGTLRSFTIAKLQSIQLGKEKNGEPRYSDAAVGTLAETVAAADHIAHYRVPNPGPGMAAYLGKKILLYGHLARVGTNEITEGTMLRGVMSEFNYITRGRSRGMARSEIGDSGSPSFFVENGELLMVGSHWKDDTDIMLPGLIPELAHTLAADGMTLETAAPH